MLKRVALLLLVMQVQAVVYIPKDAAVLELSPKNTLIALDIHGVLLQRSPSKIGKAFTSMLSNPTLLKHLFSLDMWYELIQQVITGARVDTFYMLFCDASDLLVEIFLEFANAYTVIPGTVELLTDLKQRGYQLRVASNIGQNIYPTTRKSFPELFNEQLVQDGMTTVCVNNQAVHKPESAYYTLFIELFNRDKDKQIVFVDDRLENVRAAVDHGMVGIHYIDRAQLQADLCKLGIQGQDVAKQQ